MTERCRCCHLNGRVRPGVVTIYDPRGSYLLCLPCAAVRRAALAVVLLVVLLGPGAGWAGEVSPLPQDFSPGDTVVFMQGVYDKDHPPQLAPKDFQCLVKMREAMRAMDFVIRTVKFDSLLPEIAGRYIRENDTWLSTMRDCVKGE